MIIRDYTGDDRKSLVSLIAEFQDYERQREPSYCPGIEIAEYYLEYMLIATASGNGKILVAEDEGKVFGYSCFHIQSVKLLVFSKEIKIEDIYLCQEYRGKGIGRKFIQEAEEFAKQNKIQQISLNVLSRNTEAREMYKKCGLREFEIVMTKDVK